MKPRAQGRRPGSLRRFVALSSVGALSVSVLAACGGDSGSGATTINWYVNPNSSGSYQQIATACEESSNGAYEININVLPATADGQREQIVRRLAAGDTSIDVVNVDPPYMPELANAGWLQPFTESQQEELLDGVLEAPIESAMWKGQLVGAPWEANTQLLWYKKSVAEAAGVDPTEEDFTWDQMLDAAVKTGTIIAEQGNKYEGYMVWVNAMVLGAGGQILENNELGRDADVTINSPEGREAAALIEKVSNSDAAQATLTTATEPESLANFQTEDGGFMLNWPYVYAAFKTSIDVGSLDASFLDDVAWARYPRVNADEPSKPPLGGNNIAISKFSTKKAESYEFVKCAMSPESEKINLLVNGSPAANGEVYDDAEVQEAVPMAELMRESINAAGPRPVTPFYGDVSASIQRTWHPSTEINPDRTPAKSAVLIDEVMHDKRLL